MKKYIALIPLMLLICAVSYADTWELVPLRSSAQRTAGLALGLSASQTGGEATQMPFHLATDPSDANNLYVSIDTCSPWRSIDGGTSWQFIPMGHTTNGAACISVKPTDSNTLLMAGSSMEWTNRYVSTYETGIFRSTDKGDTWTKVHATMRFNRNTLCKNTEAFCWNGNTVYALEHKVASASTTQTIYKSTDSGSTWSSWATIPAEIYGIVKPTGTTTMYGGGSPGLYRINPDNGATTLILSKPIRKMVVHPTDADIAYVAVYTTADNGVWKTTNLSAATPTWAKKTTGINAAHTGATPWCFEIAISPVNGDRLYLRYEVYATTDPTPMYYSSDGATTWVAVDIYPTNNYNVGNLAAIFPVINTHMSTGGMISPDTGTALKAFCTEIMPGSIRMTSDGGQTWTYRGHGISGFTGYGYGHIPSFHSQFGFDTANADLVSYVSADFAVINCNNFTTDATWTQVSRPPKYPASGGENRAQAVARRGNTVVCAQGKAGNEATLVTSVDAGNSWFPLDADSTRVAWAYSLIEFDSNNENLIYAGYFRGTRGSNLQNFTWSTALARFVDHVWKRAGYDYLYSYVTGDKLIRKSEDKGVTWLTPYTAFPGTGTVKGITVSPANENVIYLLTYGSTGQGGVWKLTGTPPGTWARKTSGIELDSAGNYSYQAIAIDPLNANNLYIGSYVSENPYKGAGMHKSADAGETWTNISGNTGKLMTVCMRVNPHTGVIYNGSHAGTWRVVSGADTTNPVINITVPTTQNYFGTTTATVTVSGSASDAGGFGAITYSLTGATTASGSAAGTTAWSINNLALNIGTSTLVVTATDAASNVATDSIVLERTTEEAVSPVPDLAFPHTDETMVIDGNLTELSWETPGANFLTQEIQGVKSGTGSAKGLWDANYLYIGFIGTDTAKNRNPAGTASPWLYTGAEFYLDVLNNNGAYGSDDFHFIIPWNQNNFLHEAAGKTTGVLMAVGTVTNGYTVEMAIPWTLMGIVGTNSTSIGIDVQQNFNTDADDTREGAIDMYNYLDTNYLNTDNFGVAILGTQTQEGGGEPGSSSVTKITGEINRWKFDEGSGSSVSDSVGGCPGTKTADTNMSWNAGRYGASVSFAGTSSLNCGSPSGLDDIGTRTVVAIINPLNIYGCPWNADSLGNLEVGKEAGRILGVRFRSLVSGTATGALMFYVYSPGYYSGNGGSSTCTLQTDDGTPSHFPSGVSLGTSTITNPYNNGNFREHTFDAPVYLTRGSIYHLCFVNNAVDPINNYTSLDYLENSADVANVQPGISDIDLSATWKSSGAAAWMDKTNKTPIFRMNFSSGETQGQGYFDALSSSGLYNISGTSSVRETFTVTGGYQDVANVAIRIKKTGAPASLNVRLELTDGTLVDEGTVTAASVATSYSWITCPFSNYNRLGSGTSYNLTLSCAAGDAYQIYPIKEGTVYGFTCPQLFLNGHYQTKVTGNWTNYSGLTIYDMQFYFNASTGSLCGKSPGTGFNYFELFKYWSLWFTKDMGTTDLSVPSLPNAATTNEWQTVSMDWNGGTGGVTHYINGISVANATSTTGVGAINSDAAENFFIGNRNTGLAPFIGALDDLRIFNKKLTAQEHLDCAAYVQGTTTTALDITSISATLYGSMSITYGTTNAVACFDYGTAPGVYTESTTAQNTSRTTVGVSDVIHEISGLTAGTTYYYRLRNDNPAYKATGSELSFVTLSADATAPTLEIVYPTSASNYQTYSSLPLLISGSASDNLAVSQVVWINETMGTSGVCLGTTQWNVQELPITEGTNTCKFTAFDSSNNQGTDTINIYRNLDTPTVEITSPEPNCTLIDGTPAIGTTGALFTLSGLSSDAYNGVGTVSISNSATTTVSTATGTQSFTSSIRVLPILDDGLVFYGKLDETTGSQIKDYSRYASHGTNTGSTVGTLSVFGGSRYFDGVDDSVGFPNSSQYNPTTSSFSYGCWANIVTDITSYDSPLSKGGDSPSSAGYSLFLGTGQWEAQISNGVSKAAGTFTPVYNSWTLLYVVVNRGSNSLKTYQNGVQVGTASLSSWGVGSSTSSSTLLTIGRLGSGLVRGYMDEVRIYNRVLSQAEIAQLYTLTTPDQTNKFSATAYDVPLLNQGTDTIAIGAFPTTQTADATLVTTNSATFNGTCSANLNTSTVWFEYGLTTGEYTGSSSTTVITDNDASIAIPIGALNQDTEYFYRIRASNNVGETYGEEFSFSTDVSTDGRRIYTLEEVTGLSKPLSWSTMASTKFKVGLKAYGIYNPWTHWRSTADKKRLIDDTDEEITQAIEAVQ